MNRWIVTWSLILAACGGGSGTTECVFLLGDADTGGSPGHDSGTSSDAGADTAIPTPVLPPTGEVPECATEPEALDGLVTSEMFWVPEAIDFVAGQENIGVTVSYAQDSNDNSTAYVVYREAGGGDWVWAHPLSVDRAHTEMRGSLLGLKPASQYEVRVAVDDPDGIRGLSVLCGTVSTLSDTVATATPQTLQPGDFDQTILNVGSGTPEQWAVVQGLAPDTVVIQAATDGSIDAALAVTDMSYVVFRNLTFRGGRNAVTIARSHHIRFDNCHFTGWGQDGNPTDNNHGLLLLASGPEEETVHHIEVLNSRIDTPLGNASDWGGGQPSGPHGITVQGGGGGHWFHHNMIRGDDDHWLVDGIGGTNKEQADGGLGADTDVAYNTFSHCNDNGVDAGGSQANTRIYRNRFVKTYAAVATVPVVLGPVYVYRNIAHDLSDRRGVAETFARVGGAGGNAPIGLGAQHYYHNTIYGPAVDGKTALPVAVMGTSNWGSGGDRYIHLTAHNNIWITDQAAVVDNHYSTDPITNHYDYNLSPHLLPLALQTGGGTSGTHAEPHGVLYMLSDSLFIGSMDGDFRLSSQAPATDKGRLVRGFNDVYQGAAPDVGALERGDLDDFVPPLPPVPEPDIPPEEEPGS